MRKIAEVLRLKVGGLNMTEIARSTGIGRTTVYEYLSRAEAAEVAWPLPADLDEAAVEAKLFPSPTATLAARRPVPEWRDVHRELKRGRHVTLRLLCLEWRVDHAEGWGYSQFCLHYHQWLGLQDVVMRLEYAAGDRCFVDFAGDHMSIVDEADAVTEVEIFVAVLGCSGLLYVETTRGQDLKSWLLAHDHADSAYGGVPRVTVPDNLKSGVTKACWYDPEINRSYLQMARHFNTVVLPTRTARPRDKAAVEAAVLVVERWVLAPLRNRCFFSLVELNEAIAEKVAEINAREVRGQPTSRRARFDGLERSALQPLPWRGTSSRRSRRPRSTSTTTSSAIATSTRCRTDSSVRRWRCGRWWRRSRSAPDTAASPVTHTPTGHGATRRIRHTCPPRMVRTRSGRRRG